MAERLREYATFSKTVRVLGDSLSVERNHVACVDTADGLIYPMVAGVDTLIPIGMFAESATSGVSTDTEVEIELFEEVRVFYWENADAPNAVTNALFMQDCYMLDSETVTADSDTNANAVAGKVWEVSEYGVGVITHL